MTTYKTTCPHCQASFKITDEQLKLKKGRARCGRCSNIFQADKYLTAMSAPKAQKRQAPVQNHGALDDEFDELFNDSELKRKPAPPVDDDFGIDDIQDGLIHDDVMHDNSMHDEIDLDKDLGASNMDMGELIEGEFTQEFNTTHGRFPIISDDAQYEKDQSHNNEQWLDDLLSDDDSAEYDHANENTDEPEDLVSFLEDIGANTAQFSAVSTSPLKQQAKPSLQQTKEPPQKSSADPEEPAPATKNKERTPKRSKPTLPTTSLLSGLFWLLMCLLLVAALAGQYVYFNFENFAKDPSKRDQLMQVCGLLGCNVPLADASLVEIRDAKNDVESKTQSRIYFLLANTSSEPMLVPAVKVTLLKGNTVIGGNLLKPNDYLVKEYKRITSTPVDAEIVVNMPADKYDNFKIEPVY